MFQSMIKRLKSMLWKVILFLIAINLMVRTVLLVQYNDVVAGKEIQQQELVFLNLYERKPVKQSGDYDYYDDAENKTDYILWTPYMSLDSFTASDKHVDTVAFQAMHWMDVWPKCTDYFSASVRERVVYPYFYGNCNDDANITSPITLIIQMDASATHWDDLQQTAAYWDGPISLGFYMGREQDMTNTSGIHELLDHRFRYYDLEDSMICVHLMLEKIHPEDTYFYPVNSVRNVAIEYSNTSYLFHIDSYFVPMPGLAGYLMKSLKSWNTTLKAFVIPAYKSEKTLDTFPRKKKDLVSVWHNHTIVQWQEKKTIPVQLQNLQIRSGIYKVNYTANFIPYYVVEKSLSPNYPEEILFGRHDRLIHSVLLNKTGYEFYVISDAFIIHQPHSPGISNQSVLTPGQQKCADIAFTNLQRSIRKKEKEDTMLKEKQEREEKEEKKRLELERKKKEQKKSAPIVSIYLNNPNHPVVKHQKHRAAKIMRKKSANLQNNKHTKQIVIVRTITEKPEKKMPSNYWQVRLSNEHWWALAGAEKGLNAFIQTHKEVPEFDNLNLLKSDDNNNSSMSLNFNKTVDVEKT